MRSPSYEPVRPGKAHPNDLGVTPSPDGPLWLIGPDLAIHRPDWSSQPAPARMPRLTACGYTIGATWKCAAGEPRRPICTECAGVQ